MNTDLKGELTLMDNLGVKFNYVALGRKYALDWKNVKKYHNSYKGESSTRNKGSKLDDYRVEIIDKLSIRKIIVRGIYEFMIRKCGISRICSYQNFNRYVMENNLKPTRNNFGHPHYERNSDEQGHVDWKEDILLANKYGEIFSINVLHVTLKFSRYSHLDFSIQRRYDDIARGLINSFTKFGGVPKELLFDNMSTVANVHTKPKSPPTAISKQAKDFGFKVKFCGTRKPETKGTVEVKNKFDWIRVYEGEFEMIEEWISIVEIKVFPLI